MMLTFVLGLPGLGVIPYFTFSAVGCILCPPPLPLLLGLNPIAVPAGGVNIPCPWLLWNVMVSLLVSMLIVGAIASPMFSGGLFIVFLIIFFNVSMFLVEP